MNIPTFRESTGELIQRKNDSLVNKAANVVPLFKVHFGKVSLVLELGFQWTAISVSGEKLQPAFQCNLIIELVGRQVKDRYV